MSPDLDAVVTFLQILRPGNWTLTMIIPDGKTTTKTFDGDTEGVRAFVAAHNIDKNAYYTLNELKPGTSLTKKPTKSDFAWVHWVHADLDPNEDESPTDAKARYLKRLAAFKYKPTLIVDSGNGIQALWRILAVGPERFAHAEAVSKWIMKELGSKAGTQNIDRILRLPSTINWPNRVKRDLGREPVMAVLLQYNEDCAYELDDFELPADPVSVSTTATTPDGHHSVLWWTIRTGGVYQDVGKRSEGVWWVINEMLRRGYCRDIIERTMLNRDNLITRHIFDQAHPTSYTNAQIANAKSGLNFVLDEKTNKPLNVRYNLRIALMKMGIKISYNEFNDRTLIEGLDDYGPDLTDEAVLHIRMLCDHECKFYPGKDMSFEVVIEIAQLNRFHPVKEYFAGLKWDGVKRLDKWLVTYAGATDNEYVSAIGALMLTAAVRRIKSPGAKFDEMVVLESPVQGTNKSSALEILASTDWFTDYLPFNIDGKQVIEALRGRLIIEAAELSGMRRTEIEHMKAFLSRTVDRGRMSYDRATKNVPRECVIVGTTNDSQYLKDTGGNRRFWPVRVKEFDLAALRRDRDQLWAEAVTREATGVSIRLDPVLWESAAQEQLKRVVSDPYFDMLKHHLENFTCGKITSETLRLIVDMRSGSATQDQNHRLIKAMRELGWKRPNTAGTIVYDGRNVPGWVIGEVQGTAVNATRPLISAYKDRESGQVIISIEGGRTDDGKPTEII